MVEVDAGAATDDGDDPALVAVDLDLGTGVPVLLVDLVGGDRPDLVVVVLAERLLGADLDRSGGADFLADQRVVDALEDVSGADHDDPRLEVVLVGVDLGVLGDLCVGRVDDLAVVGGSERVR